MYDIRQFKPMLYVLLILGFSGFALAAQTPGLWVLSIAATLFHAYLCWRGRFKPMPRLITNLIALLVLAWGGAQWFNHLTNSWILLVGQALILLQLVKLYELRGNRDSAQLLILSLLLMVAASISTDKLLFGVILIVYLFLSLYVCLLFHLKVETDEVRKWFAAPADEVDPVTLRRDQQRLSQSMRRLSSILAVVAVGMATLVFLFFPRIGESNMLPGMQPDSSQTLTGFGDQVSFQQVARITQNNQPVGYVQVWRNGQLVQGTQTLLLRGVTLDVYHGDDLAAGAWQWSRSNQIERTDLIGGGQPQVLDSPPPKVEWKQKIILLPTGTPVLFALAGPWQFTPVHDLKIRYFPEDQSLQTPGPLLRRIEYEVVSGNELPPPIVPPRRMVGVRNRLGAAGMPQKSRIDPRIDAFARLPEVTGGLAQKRTDHDGVDPLDEQIARNIERYLRTHFTYSLDLTDAQWIAGEDPLSAFLYRLKRGHCEYFAGAMTLLCQSLHIRARMVLGFRVEGDAYNSYTDNYGINQSQAHAWVEVLTERGWQTFDPTSGRDAPASSTGGLWRNLRNAFDFLEYTWGANVIAYSGDDRTNLVQNLDNWMTNTAISGSMKVGRLGKRLNTAQFKVASSKVLSALVLLLTAALLLAVAWFAAQRWRRRRRAVRIGIDALPADDQQRLLRQLGFYDDLLRLLARRQIVPPRHQTPLEFSRSLEYLPAEAYGTIHRLTRLFYRIRFGGAQLRTEHQRRVAAALARLAAAMPEAGPGQ